VRRWPLLVSGACVALMLLGGCGGSTAHKTGTRAAVARRDGSGAAASTPCASRSRDAVARFLALAPASVSVAAGKGNNLMPQCTFTAHPAHASTVSMVANIDNGPQPYFILERTAVETSQLFGPKRFVAAPTALNNLGIEADWFPNLGAVMSTDGLQLITVTMNWPGAPVGRKIALGEALSRTYLKKLSPQEVNRLANGAPAGG
jgi:hypothetical protein